MTSFDKLLKMKNLHKTIIVVAALTAGCCSASFAQSPEHRQEVMELLREDPTRSVNLHHNYEAPSKIVDTPAPKGYKPFYVSHYGRHGSRYHYTADYMDRPLAVLDSLDAHGLLTEEGRAVLNDLNAIKQAHDGQIGYLTHKGAAQHLAIAERLCHRCPEIFRQNDRKEVYCVSTGVQRCIQSMANFCGQVAREYPELHITMDAGDRFTRYLCNTEGVPAVGKREKFVMDSVLIANLDPSRLLSSLTTSPEAAVKFMKNGPEKFFADVVWGGGIGQCLDIEDPYVYRHFTLDELYAIWAYNDVNYYNVMNGTVENRRSKDLIGARILSDIIEKADAAVAGNDHAADLRFGHDTGLAPTFSTLRVKGLEKERKMADAIDGVWYGFRGMPMASNLQMIFYRNKKGDVLVKILRNEVETTIPALKAVSGPYYRWDDLRGFIVDQIDGLDF